jgi:hypothetical protein
MARCSKPKHSHGPWWTRHGRHKYPHAEGGFQEDDAGTHSRRAESLEGEFLRTFLDTITNADITQGRARRTKKVGSLGSPTTKRRKSTVKLVQDHDSAMTSLMRHSKNVLALIDTQPRYNLIIYPALIHRIEPEFRSVVTGHL